MNSETGEFIWLCEPLQRDETKLRERERFIHFLKRSTRPEARSLRQFLNYNLARLPEQPRDHFVREFQKKKWGSVFFELIVARTLQLLGGSILIEQPLPTGKKPDLSAKFDDGPIVVEATAPEFERELRRILRERHELCEIIESLAPAGFVIDVIRLPELRPKDSKQEFKRKLHEEFRKVLPPQPETQFVRFCLASGDCELSLRPRGGKSAIGFGASAAVTSDVQTRIHRAVQRKRKQVRDATSPVLLAINAQDTAHLEDVDIALFGRWYSSGRFSPDGTFAKKREGEPTYAGVLACFVPFVWVETAEHIRIPDPVLYIHPRCTQPLPIAVRQLQTRTLTDSEGIRSIAASVTDLLRALRPAP